jgi:hypothetical protein
MAAQVYFNSGGEPSEVVAVFLFKEKGGFREIHLLAHGLHPCRLTGLGKKADRGRISGEGFFRKSVDLVDGYRQGGPPIVIWILSIGLSFPTSLSKVLKVGCGTGITAFTYNKIISPFPRKHPEQKSMLANRSRSAI